mmetsp:Transcript_27855/g.58966  ORF Transcript_27855/g.58966 Transcript_27855/m.58966 type:complete len:255 (-) Transcript_27855:103-867(-)
MHSIKQRAQAAKDAVTDKWKEGWEEFPNGKAAEVACGCCGGAPSDAPYIQRLRSELANSYYWSGSFVKDYFFFVCNWHPMLGMLLSHPNHPWTKTERFLMFLISLSISIIPSAVIASSIEQAAVTTTATITLVTIPNIIVGVVLYQLSIADTRQACVFCIPCLSMCKTCCMCSTLFIGLASTGISYLIMTSESKNPHWEEMLNPLIMGQVYSQITWFPLWIVLPCQLGFVSLWCAEKKELTEEAAEEAKGLTAP